MAEYKHGVYVDEASGQKSAAIAEDLGVQVVVGTAPINMTANPSGAVNVPKLCSTLDEVKAAVGYSENCDWTQYTICQSVYASLVKFGVGPIVVINVLDPATHKVAVAQGEFIVKNKKCTIPVFGVVLSSIVIKSATDGTALKVDTDYVLAFDDSGNVTVALLASGSAASAAKLYIAYDKLDPSKVTADDIIGGKTAAGVETGLELIRQIYPMLNVNAGLITAPTWSKNAAVAAVMEAKCSSINGCFDSESVVDIDSTVTKLYSDVETGKGTLGVTGTHSIVCWPMWHENNKVISLSAIAAARMTATDMANDQVPYKSPSNKSLGDEGYACLEDGTKVLLDQEQANVINGVGVVTALNLRGFVLWGNNTAAYPSSTEAKDRWISVRRFFTWWTNRFINTYIKRIDENVSRRMVETIVDDENIVCNGYVARGYVPGASISVDYDNSVFADGKLVFSEKIGAYPPAESITNKVSCDTSYLQSEFGGES